jgi:molybdate transport system substrate-binding protein
MRNKVGHYSWCLVLVICLPGSVAAKVVVFGAASLTQVLTEISAKARQATGLEVSMVLGSSGALARQIDQGAPADICFLANEKWMDYLEKNGRLEPASRVDLLSNRLVVIAPKGAGFKLEALQGSAFAALFDGRLALADPAHVPAGIYAQQALQWLGWWPSLAGRLVPAADVRAALVYVERGACGAGVVYATDAASSSRVEVVATVPMEAHEAIVYPVALIRGRSGAEAVHFLEYLQSESAGGVYREYGFGVLPPKNLESDKASNNNPLIEGVYGIEQR